MKEVFMKKNVFMILCILILSVTANAGDKGNGGDVLVCNNRIVLLDRYEAEKRNFMIDIPGITLKEKVSTLIERLKVYDRYNGENIEKTTTSMLNDLQIGEATPNQMQLIALSTDILNDIDDSFETAIPAGCRKEQLIAKKNIIYMSDKKFEIRSDLWDLLSLEDKAMAIFHEAVYDYLTSYGAEDSRFARYLNGFFAQDDSKRTYLGYITNTLMAERQGIKMPLFFIDPVKQPYRPYTISNYTYELEPARYFILKDQNQLDRLAFSIEYKDEIELDTKNPAKYNLCVSEGCHKLSFYGIYRNKISGLITLKLAVPRSLSVKNGEIFFKKDREMLTILDKEGKLEKIIGISYSPYYSEKWGSYIKKVIWNDKVYNEPKSVTFDKDGSITDIKI